ncbi:MAG: DNA/RNA nuclease SfsA [Armatimonadetes bacterium]|nr:DNA/RNA nuclease SfsA [Armatimonadota bacterium]
MLLRQPLLAARFITRPNRFATWAELEGTRVYCHMPNPGRMQELLHEGAELWVRPSEGQGRVTTHDVVLVRHGESLVCLDSRLPPDLFMEALVAGLAPELGACSHVRREVTVGASRLDLELACDTGAWLVETKSCTLRIGDVARFPDAPTKRGARHLEELVVAQRAGYSTAVAFMIQREDTRVFAPNRDTDPEFAAMLRAAAKAGVQVLAIRCLVTPETVEPVQRVPVDLDL